MPQKNRERILLVLLGIMAIALIGTAVVSFRSHSDPIINIHEQDNAEKNLQDFLSESPAPSPLPSGDLKEDETAANSTQETASANSEDSEKMNINTATKEQLDTLKGIGPATADKIIAYREQTPFLVIEDLKKVSGIGQKKFDAIKDQICVE